MITHQKLFVNEFFARFLNLAEASMYFSVLTKNLYSIFIWLISAMLNTANVQKLNRCARPLTRCRHAGKAPFFTPSQPQSPATVPDVAFACAEFCANRTKGRFSVADCPCTFGAVTVPKVVFCVTVFISSTQLLSYQRSFFLFAPLRFRRGRQRNNRRFRADGRSFQSLARPDANCAGQMGNAPTE